MGTHTRYTIPSIQRFYCALDTCSASCFSLQPYGTVRSRYTIAHHTLLGSNGPVRLIITVTRTKPAQQPSLIHLINDSGRDKCDGDEDTVTFQESSRALVAKIAVLLLDLSERWAARAKPFTLRSGSPISATLSRANDEKICSSRIHHTLHTDWACANCNEALRIWHLNVGHDRSSRMLAVETFTLGLTADTPQHTASISCSANIPRLRGCRQSSPGEDRKKQLLQSALDLYPRSFVHQAIFPHRSNTARHGSGSFRPIPSCLIGLFCKCRCALLSCFSRRLLVLQDYSPVTSRARRHQASFS